MGFRSWVKFSDLGARFPFAVLLLSGFVTVLSVFSGSKLSVQSDITSLLPRQLGSVQGLDQLKQNFGGLGHLVVTVESDDPAQAENFAEAFVRRLKTHPAVRYVDFRRPLGYFNKRQWLYMDLEDLHEVERRVDDALRLQKKGISPVFSHLMDFADREDRIDLDFSDLKAKYEKRFGVSSDEILSSNEGRLLVVRVKLQENPQNLDATRALMGDFKKMEGEIKEGEGFLGVTVGYTGAYQKMIEQADLIRGEIIRVSALVTFLLFLILLAYFRRISAALFVALPISLSILWTGGLVFLLLGHLNMITGFAAAILAGLGSDYGIYLLSRYFQERARGAEFEEAYRLAFSKTGRATYLSTVTSVGAFGALLFSRFGLFLEFGVVGVLGLIMNYLAIMILLPALLSLEERYRRDRKGIRRFIGWDSSLQKMGRKLGRFFHRPSTVRQASFRVMFFLFICMVSGFSLPMVSRIQFEDGQLENRSLPSFRISDRVSHLFPLSLNPTVLMVQGAEGEKKVVGRIEALLHKEGENKNVFNQVVGLSSFIPDFQSEKKDVLRRIHQKVRSADRFWVFQRDDFLKSLKASIESPSIAREDLPVEIRRVFESHWKKDLYAVYLNPAFGRVSAESMRRYHEGILDLQKDLQKEMDVKFAVADGTFVNDDVVKMMQKEAPMGIALVLIFLGAVAFLKIKPWKRGAVVFAHLVGSLLLLAGVMWLFRMSLNVINMAVIPIVLGTGIDCFIHFSERFDETGSLFKTLRTEIPTILISNFTSIVGFGGLLLTSSSGLRSAGWVSVLGILIVTLVCVYDFPRCLNLLWAKPSQVPSPDVETEAAGI